MSMILEKDKNRIKVIIPNSEATILAQLNCIKDSEVTGYYMNDNKEIKNEFIEFLAEEYDYLLNVQATIEVINYITLNFYDDYNELYKDKFSSLKNSLDYFKSINKKFIRIPRMYYSGQNNRYYKFENSDTTIKKLRAILYGDITGFYLFKDNNYYIVQPFVVENAKENLEKSKAKILTDMMNGEKMKEKFREWLNRDSSISKEKISNYVNTISIVSNEGIKDGIFDKSIFDINTLEEFDKIYNIIHTNDNKRFYINDDSLTYYRQFLISYTNHYNERCKETNSYTKEDFLNEVYIDSNKYNSIVSILEKKKNIILEGAPGVGKTFMAKRLAYSILGEINNENLCLIQFHQSYAYEDFIEGYRPTKEGFSLEKGVFFKFCKKADADPNNNYYMIIDEINRGNMSKIFGELLMLIEADKRGDSLELAYSKEKFSVPSNLYIIGLMNTADRSLALIDYALRRRFSFIKIEPAFENHKFLTDFKNKFDNDYSKIFDIIKQINVAIENDRSLGAGFKIGHSYFCPILKDRKGNKQDIEDIIRYEIIPLLEEYWYDDEDSIIQWENALNGFIND